MQHAPLDLVSLAAFAFGVLTFSTLAAYYWGARRRTTGSRSVLPAFTLVCAIAFLNSMVLQVFARQGVVSTLVRYLTAGLLPALILHLVFEVESGRLPARRAWRWVVFAFYACAVFPILEGLDETGLVSINWSDGLYRAPAILLAASGAIGLWMQVVARRPEARDRAYRRWVSAVLMLMLACAGASLGGFGALVGPVPDYLLLLFFAVTLYYRERLVFFDLLVKRGVFLAVGLTLLALCLSADGTAWIPAAGLLLAWLSAPWVNGHVGKAIDRVWLRRTWSPVEAERRFMQDIQIAATEEELRAQAEGGLSAIFQAPAEVHFDRPRVPGASDAVSEDLIAELERNGARSGHIRLRARKNGLPFLSDDRKLADSLARTLGVLLENVRFREERRRQEEREQELRWLAGRAELKALRAQINPHFLFNALSVIGGLLHYQPELADETIEQLAQVFRYTLRKSESEWAPLAEEVEFVSAYLRIEQARFGARLRLDFDVDPSAAHFLIPSMSIQPLVENAIKHGTSAREGCGTVGLRVAMDTGTLSVGVLDNGPGFPPGYCMEGQGNGHGLRNIAERLRGYYGDRASLSWESGPQGTRVALRIPQPAISGGNGGIRDTRPDCRR